MVLAPAAIASTLLLPAALVRGAVMAPIAGDVRIAKAAESVTGTVTYVSYTGGYFRLDGIPGDNATVVMVRVNDPSDRHTIRKELGCAPGNAENCSADARFGIDSSNRRVP